MIDKHGERGGPSIEKNNMLQEQKHSRLRARGPAGGIAGGQGCRSSSKPLLVGAPVRLARSPSTLIVVIIQCLIFRGLGQRELA